ncbi:MAG: hypothetical protein ACC645_01645 [Pirellulales bacterium]
MNRTCPRWGWVLVLALLTGSIAAADEPSVWSRLWPFGKQAESDQRGPRSHRQVSWPVASRQTKTATDKRGGQSTFGRIAEVPKRWWEATRDWLASPGRKAARHDSTTKRRERRSGLFAKKEAPKAPLTTKEFFAQKRPAP